MLIPYRKGELWGYADQRGALVVVPQFEEAGFLTSGRARVRFKGKYGYLDGSGNYAIPPEYDSASLFEEYARVTKGGRTFHIDRYGQPVSREALQKSRGVKCGGSIVRISHFQRYMVDGKIGLLVHERCVFDSLAGKRTVRYDTLPGLFDEFRENYKGLAAVRVGNCWGMLDQQGQWLLPPEYEAIEFNSYARGDAVNFFGRICKDGRWGLVDEKGAITVSPKYASIKALSNGLFQVKPMSQAAGYMDKTGREFFED